MKTLKKGFVLIELMVAIAVIGILLSYTVPTYFFMVNNAKRSQCLSNRKMIERTVEYFKSENGYYDFNLSSLYNKGYFSNLPKCVSGGEYVWVSTNPPVMGCSIHYWPVDVIVTTQPPVYQKFSRTIYPISWDDISSTYGNWEIKDNILYNVGSNKHNLFFKIGNSSNSLSDFSMSVNFNTNGNFGLYYRTDQNVSRPTGYYLYYSVSSQKLIVYNMTLGVARNVIASVSLPSKFPMTYQSHDIVISAVGSLHTVKIDGVEYLKFSDKTYSKGGVGVTTNSPSKGTEITKVNIEEI